MKHWIQTQFNQFRKGRLLAAVLALALAAGFGTYEFAQPVAAHAAAGSGTAAPIDDSSVSALLALDRAMETLAARVTPAVVNVAVTARVKPQTMTGENLVFNPRRLALVGVAAVGLTLAASAPVKAQVRSGCLSPVARRAYAPPPFCAVASDSRPQRAAPRRAIASG